MIIRLIIIYIIHIQVEFSLSRFKLPVNVLQTVYKKKRLIRFKLDPSRPNPVVSKVEGFWYVGSSDR